MSGPQGRMWLVPRPFCHVTVILSDDPSARKAAGLPAEAPKQLVKRGRTGRVAAAVTAAGARTPKVDKAEKGAAKKSATPKTKKPAAKPTKSDE